MQVTVTLAEKQTFHGSVAESRQAVNNKYKSSWADCFDFSFKIYIYPKSGV